MKITNTRNQTADILKGLAVIFMIQVHIMEQFASAEANSSIIGRIFYFLGGPFCAPVFVAVMGYFLAASRQSFAFYLKRGLSLFFLGILLNIGRSVHLFVTIFQGKYDLDPLHFIFGADILSLAGLSIILLAVLQLISKKSLLFYFSLMLLFAVLGNFINDSIPTEGFFLAYFAANIDHSYFPLFPWFSYVLAGYVFKLIYDKFHDYFNSFTTVHWIITALLSIIILIFSPYAFNISNDLPTYYHHGFTFFLWVIGFMIIYVILINYMSKLLRNSFLIDYLSWTGKNVTVVYVIQWIIIGNIATAIFQTQNLVQSVFWFVGVTVISSLLALAYLKMKKYYKNRREALL